MYMDVHIIKLQILNIHRYINIYEFIKIYIRINTNTCTHIHTQFLCNVLS